MTVPQTENLGPDTGNVDNGGATGQGTDQLSGQQGEQQNSGHPAWQPILDALPDDALRNMVTPHLQAWDKGVQDRFQSLHSQYEPWKQFADNEVDPQLVQQALDLVQRLEDDPEYVYNKLAEAYGFGSGQGTQNQQQGQQLNQQQPQVVQPNQPINIEGTEYDANDPLIQKITQLEGVLGGLQNFIQSQQQQNEQQQQIAAWEQLKTQLKTSNPGPWDDDVIDAMVANGVSPQDAVTRYQTAVKNAAQAQVAPTTTAPVVMGANNGGSGLPSQQTDPAKLNSQDTKALVVQMLKNAAENNG